MNLDIECAKTGEEIASKVFEIFGENNKTGTLITKSLGVLQEDGVYASLLYLESQGSINKDGTKTKEKFAAEAIRDFCFQLLQRNIPGWPLEKENDVLSVIRNKLADNLDALLFSKYLLERTLVYARYHAKALGKQESASPDGRH